MPPIALTYVYTDLESMEGLLSASAIENRVDDDANGTVSTPEDDWPTWSQNIASARINSFCAGRYEIVDLAKSWSVWNWATILACYWLCCRRGNPVPTSILGLYQETMEELQMVQLGQLLIDDLAMRNSFSPIWSNGRIDDRYMVRKYRVERPLSDSTPVPFPRKTDLLADIIPEPPLPI